MADKPLTVLAIDDDPGDLELLRRCVEEVRNPPLRLVPRSPPGGDPASLRDEPADVILLDYLMGSVSGLQLLEQLRSLGDDRPILILTGQGDEQLAVEAMKAGASDYLVKARLDPDHLRRAVVNALEKASLRRHIEAQRQALMQAERQRVMLESIGAACHHISQPLQSMMGYLQIMQLDSSMEPGRRVVMLGKCLDAVRLMEGVLRQLQEVGQYRTVPYLDGSIVDIRPGDPPGGD